MSAPRPLHRSTFGGIITGLIAIGVVASGFAAVGMSGMIYGMATTMGGNCNAAYRGEYVADANGCPKSSAKPCKKARIGVRSSVSVIRGSTPRLLSS